ncbi:MAG TPA: hypothetical protein VGQ91_16650 [Ideonella sp.]|jgi:hypothetical protein|nr:hypothetical protein [Ideonella sp.]
MSLAIPELPRSVRASMLLNGSNADFVINAYLALQRQWPDVGGYGHYLYVLGQPGASRATVLREIAASDNARRCGIEFVDDLPADHLFKPEDNDRGRLTDLSLSLRLGRAVADLEQLRRSVSKLTTDKLVGAVEAIVQAQQAQHSQIESRLNELAAASPRARAPSPVPSGDEAVAGGVPEQDAAAWRHLAQRQMLVETELAANRQLVQAMSAELAELRRSFAELHSHVAVDFRRQVADYVNALALAQTFHSPGTSAPAPRRPARIPPPAAERFGARQRAERG